MPVTRKQQVLAKVETSEGVSSNPVGADAVLVFDPALSDNVDVPDRVPAGPTLSRALTPTGRKTRQLTFKSDFRGSADTTIPVDEPDFAKFLKASAYKTSTVKKITLGAVTGTGFQVGEIVSQSAGAIRGVVIGAFTGTTLLFRSTTSGDFLVVVPLVGTFTAAATTGESSASTSTASAVAAYAGLCYQPTSEKSVNLVTNAWTGTAPVAGEVVRVTTSGTLVGSIQIIRVNTATDYDGTLLWGTVSTGDVLTTAGSATGTIQSGSPTQFQTSSLTIRHNLDGRRRDLLGARGDFTLEGDVGSPMQFAWTFSGNVGTTSDALAASTSGLSTVQPPRLLGAICAYGLGADIMRLPTKKVSLSGHGTVNPNLDANSSGGSTGSNVTDRDPEFSLTVDQVQSAFDWEAARDAGTLTRITILLGTTPGQIVGLVAPQGQVTVAGTGDADGISTQELTIKCRRVLESGDDEVYIFQL